MGEQPFYCENDLNALSRKAFVQVKEFFFAFTKNEPSPGP